MFSCVLSIKILILQKSGIMVSKWDHFAGAPLIYLEGGRELVRFKVISWVMYHVYESPYKDRNARIVCFKMKCFTCFYQIPVQRRNRYTIKIMIPTSHNLDLLN